MAELANADKPSSLLTRPRHARRQADVGRNGGGDPYQARWLSQSSEAAEVAKAGSQWSGGRQAVEVTETAKVRKSRNYRDGLGRQQTAEAAQASRQAAEASRHPSEQTRQLRR
jgi:hypothetical protein